MRSVVLFLKAAFYILNRQAQAVEWCYFCNSSKICKPPFEKTQCKNVIYADNKHYVNPNPTWACFIQRNPNSKKTGFFGGRPLEWRDCIDTSSKVQIKKKKICNINSPILCTICNNTDFCNSGILKKFNTNGTPLGVGECNSCSDHLCLEQYNMTCVGSHLVKYFCAIYKKPGHEIRRCEYSDSDYKKTCQEFKMKGGVCKRCEKDRCNTHIALENEKKAKKIGNSNSTIKRHHFVMARLIFVGFLAFFLF